MSSPVEYSLAINTAPWIYIYGYRRIRTCLVGISLYTHLVSVFGLWIVPSYDLLPLVSVSVLTHLLRPYLLATRYPLAVEGTCSCTCIKCHVKQLEHGAIDGIDTQCLQSTVSILSEK